MPAGRHPFFLDRHAVPWHSRLDEARAAAAASRRHIFVLHSRPGCEGSRALVEKIIVKDEIAEVLREHFECVASDVRAPDDEVTRLIGALPKQEPTPLCIYLASDGRLLHSTAGGRPAAVLLRDLTEALARK
ncbi:MAG TPA: thioredoxin family protein [Polyangia bacterium]|jgi:hypothetical protein|nr:thioredoxin family protein [Polyangia bacterium]